MSFYGLALGAICFGIVYFLGLSITRNQAKKKRKKLISQNINERMYLSSAAVSSDLVPLLKHHLSSGDRMVVVGTAGYFLSSNRKIWTDGLEKLCSTGVETEYILIDPTPAALDIFRSFFNSCSNITDAWVLEGSSECLETRELVASLKTVHPTLVSNNTGAAKLMWIEGNHPEHSHKAYDIEYTPPGKFDDGRSKVFNHWKSMIEKCKVNGISIKKPSPVNKFAA